MCKVESQAHPGRWRQLLRAAFACAGGASWPTRPNRPGRPPLPPSSPRTSARVLRYFWSPPHALTPCPRSDPQGRRVSPRLSWRCVDSDTSPGFEVTWGLPGLTPRFGALCAGGLLGLPPLPVHSVGCLLSARRLLLRQRPPCRCPLQLACARSAVSPPPLTSSPIRAWTWPFAFFIVSCNGSVLGAQLPPSPPGELAAGRAGDRALPRAGRLSGGSRTAG